MKSYFYFKEFIKKYLPKPLLISLFKIYKIVIYRINPRYNSPLGEINNINTLNCKISYNKIGGYCIPVNSIHRPAVQSILRGEVWEEETLNFLSSNLKSGDIIHAGTYFGDFLPLLSKKCSINSKVWAFEPNYENYRCAEITIKINNITNVELFNYGLGEKKNISDIAIKNEKGESLGGSSTILKSAHNFNGETQKVNIISLDEVIPTNRNINVLQLDVEGNEKEVLKGAKKLLLRCKPILVLEILPEINFLKNDIFSLGYKIVDEVQGNSILKIK